MTKRICAFTVMLILLVQVINPCNIFADNEKKPESKPVICEVLMEVSTKTILNSVNPDKKIPVGTMAKLMTVLLVAEDIESGKLTLETEVKASTYANSMQGAQIWLMPGEKMAVSDLLKGVIIGNANDASVALAEAVSLTEDVFVKLMNKRAKELGMQNTEFTNCNGYYDDDKQLSTVTDMAILLSELYKYDNLTDIFTCWHDYVRNGETELVNSNTLVRSYDGIKGFKAGYTDYTGFFTAVGASREDEDYVAVVIGCDDKDLSFTEAKRLLNYGFTSFQKFKPSLPDDIPDIIRIKGGVEKQVAVTIDNFDEIIIPNGTAKSITSRVVLPDYVYAPTKKGQVIGEIQYFRNEKLIFSVNIKASVDTSKINFAKAFVIILKFISTF